MDNNSSKSCRCPTLGILSSIPIIPDSFISGIDSIEIIFSVGICSCRICFSKGFLTNTFILEDEHFFNPIPKIFSLLIFYELCTFYSSKCLSFSLSSKETSALLAHLARFSSFICSLGLLFLFSFRISTLRLTGIVCCEDRVSRLRLLPLS